MLLPFYRTLLLRRLPFPTKIYYPPRSEVKRKREREKGSNFDDVKGFFRLELPVLFSRLKLADTYLGKVTCLQSDRT